MSVAKNLEYGSHPTLGSGINRDDVLEHLGIENLLHRKPSTLSGGESQRVAIARALLSSPQMLLMDEPLSSLDQSRKQEILPLLKSIAVEFKRPILYVSHSFEEVVQLSDKLVLLDKGQTIGQGTPEELTTNPKYARQLEGFDAGSLLTCKVEKHDSEYALTYLSFSGGSIPIPLTKHPLGSRLRIRVRARDITLANSIPEDISMLIRIQAKILSVEDVDNTHNYVRLQSGDDILLARVTRKSIDTLGIKVNKPIFCLVKSVTLEL